LLALAAVACPRHLPVLLAPGRNDDRRGLEANLLPVFVLLGAVFVGALIVGLRSWARLCLGSRAITLIAATAGFLGWLGRGAQRSLLARVAVVATLIAPVSGQRSETSLAHTPRGYLRRGELPTGAAEPTRIVAPGP